MNNKKEQIKKRMQMIIGISMMVFAIAIAGGTYAYYQSTITGDASGTILEWDCINSSGTLTNALGNLKPGSSGSFALKVKSSNFKTDVTVNFSYNNPENAPDNFKLYKESGHTNLIPVSIFDTSTVPSENKYWCFGNTI